jgi:hypothetical protein
MTIRCGGNLYGVTVYHPAYGHSESAVLQVARSGPRGILQCGPEWTARHEQEVRRQEDEANHSKAKTLWFSRLHGRYWMIALFRSEVRPAAGRGCRTLPTPSNQQGKARLAPVGREVIFSSGIYTYGSLIPA